MIAEPMHWHELTLRIENSAQQTFGRKQYLCAAIAFFCWDKIGKEISYIW